MIRTLKRYLDGDLKEYIEISCDSDDNKPTGVANGSIANETDTGAVFLYDEDSGEWVEQFSFQG